MRPKLLDVFDRQQIIEDAAKAEWAAVWPGIPYETSPGAHADFAKGTAAALPVIAAAVLKPIREQHGVPHWCMDDEGRSDCYHPDGPGMPWPCPTARLCDEIDEMLPEVTR